MLLPFLVDALTFIWGTMVGGNGLAEGLFSLACHVILHNFNVYMILLNVLRVPGPKLQ